MNATKTGATEPPGGTDGTRWVSTSNGRFGLRPDEIVEVRPFEFSYETLESAEGNAAAAASLLGNAIPAPWLVDFRTIKGNSAEARVLRPIAHHARALPALRRPGGPSGVESAG